MAKSIKTTTLLCATTGNILASYYAFSNQLGFWQGQAVGVAGSLIGGIIGELISQRQNDRRLERHNRARKSK